MSLQTYIQATPVRAMNDGEAGIADASDYLDVCDIGLVHAETPTSLSLHIRVLAAAAHRAKLLLRMPLTIRLPGQDYDASLLMWPPFRHPAKPSRGGPAPPTHSMTGTLQPLPSWSWLSFRAQPAATTVSLPSTGTAPPEPWEKLP